ncbi:MAG TPA: hypothetical protein VFB34_10540 [Chloroflexota bacterium]|nr:hypothetical protein [Chloroflexota bacterium]
MVVRNRSHVTQLADPVTLSDVPLEGAPHEFSRRQALGLAGAAAVGTSPLLHAVEYGLGGSFVLVRSPGRVAFRYRGMDRWVVDVRHFAGRPRLKVESRGQMISIELRGARYPGTDLSADFSCILKPAISGWRMSLRMALGGFSARGVAFERWLLGKEQASGPVSVRARLALSSTAELHLGGSGTGQFGPDWVVRIRGRRVARLEGLGQPLSSNRLTISLPQEESAVGKRRATRRTLVVLDRRSENWAIDLSRMGDLELTQLGSGFETIGIELKESASGRVSRSLVALSPEQTDSVAYIPSRDLKGSNLRAFELPLRDVRYRIYFTPNGERRELSAGYTTHPVWMHAEGCSFLLGHADHAGRFSLRTDARGTRLHCAPALLGVVGGLPGTVVEPVTLSKPTVLEMVPGRAAARRKPGVARLTIHHPSTGLKPEAAIPNYVVSILRPEDLMALSLEYVGFDLRTGGGAPPQLVRTQKAAQVIAHFGPQSIGEQAFFQVDPNDPLSSNTDNNPPGGDPDNGTSGNDPLSPPGQVAAILSGPSRLAFDVSPKVATIAYTLDAVMDWSKFTQRVYDTSSNPIQDPPADRTAIEAPYRLILSPSTFAYWNHTSDLVQANGQTELWHTRLGVIDSQGYPHDDNDPVHAPSWVRAIWTPDYPDAPSQHYPADKVHNPFRMPMDADDRYQIVRLSGQFGQSQPKGGTYDPTPVDVTKLMLSGLGAWMNVRGAWDPAVTPVGLDVEEWRNRSTMGRDHYVRVVYAGYMFPFGHQAALVKVTERKFVQFPDATTGGLGPIIAHLYQRLFIVIRQPTKTFNSSDYPSGWQDGSNPLKGTTFETQGRQMPFKTVEITTLVTPDLEGPTALGSPATTGAQDAFWPMISVNGTPTIFKFHVKGTDWDGNVTEFAMPLIFISRAVSLPGTSTTFASGLQGVEQVYVASANATVPMSGQRVAIAPSNPHPSAQGTDPSLEMTSITFDAAIPPDNVADSNGFPADQPQFYPVMGVADCQIPALKQLTGANSDPSIALAAEFLQYGVPEMGLPGGSSNAGEVFGHLVDPGYLTNGNSQQIPMIFGPGASGQPVTPGAMTPNLSIAGLSRMLGPVGANVVQQGGQAISDLGGIASGNFDPTSFFSDPSSLLGDKFPKLFGGIPLTGIIKPLLNFLESVPPPEFDAAGKLVPRDDLDIGKLLKVPGLSIKVSEEHIIVDYVWTTDQIQNYEIPGVKFGFEADVVNDDGTEPSPVPANVGSPPGAPDVDDGGADGSVDVSDNPSNHAWAATYTNSHGETALGVGTTFDVSENGKHTSGRKVKVKVDQGPTGTTKINIYRTQNGQNWPFYLVDSVTSKVVGSDQITYTDNKSDSDISSAANPPHSQCQFRIELNLTVPLKGGDPTYLIMGEIDYCSLQFAVMAVPFVYLRFTIKSGEKLKCDPALNEIVFEDFLQFVNGLRQYLNAFSDPPFLDVKSDHVEAGYTLALPSIDVGAFSLQNISLGAKISIPYFGDAIVISFNFCTKDNPFVLTIYIFGGGGYLEIDLGPEGLVGLHAALEFGVDCAFDIGVASGGVHIMVGIYFDYDKTNGATLTGFVDIGGNLDVLGIISLSLLFHMQLSYQLSGPDQGKCTGEASLVVEVSVLLFSASVTLGPIKKSFGGSSEEGEPAPRALPHTRATGNRLPVASMIAEDDWMAYLQAFAA